MKDNIFALNSWLSEDLLWIEKLATAIHSQSV